MTEIDAILAQELGRLGGFGARWMSRPLRRSVGEERFELAAPAAIVSATVAELLATIGNLLTLRELPEKDGMSALTGSGYFRLNPAVVTVWLTDVSPQRTAVRVRGVAKEGLLKQYGGKQVAHEVAAALKQRYAPRVTMP